MSKILFLVLLISGQTLFSQLIFNFSKDKYYHAKVYLEDGTVKEGYLKDFNDENLVSFYPQKIAESFGSMEENTGLSNDFYYFIKDENSKEEKITLMDIQKIEFAKDNDHSEQYQFSLEKTKTATINNDFQMIENNRFALLPVYFSNSKITVYAMLVNDFFPFFYLKSPENEFAVRAFRLSIGDVFNTKSISTKTYESLDYFGKDCEKFSENLLKKKDYFDNEFLDVIKMKFNYKLFQEKRGLYEKDLKKAKKSMGKEDFLKYKSQKTKEYLDEKTKYFYDTVLNEIVIDYINSCE